MVAQEPNKPRGIHGSLMLQIARELDFSPEDFREIAEAVEDCEKIDWDEWDSPTDPKTVEG